ncbi:MAG TPA: hypothetical protein HA252_02070 [Candidatus Diapherotrites archaeon]|uniref:Uncharacterized protein n=1 Tax=Candidatus Iainarchaeum sp. TaxID=3101447 RepID=A0A7J4JJP9_9ARCH|nr:hypothetical protein [Candidatus Diapherotrites archaeon]HIH16167.1 hypothetical protein [Candidatus Diapherotrites archaeon]
MQCDIKEDACSSEETGAGCRCECGEANCECGSNEGGCGSGLKGCGSGGHAEMIFGAALRAKHELLTEKIKARLEKAHGRKFDEVAELVVGVLAAKWKGKQEMAKKWEEFNEKLEAIFEEGK